MVRGGRGYSPRGTSYRGSSRGGNQFSGGGGYNRSSSSRGTRGHHYSSFESSSNNYDKGRNSSDRYSRDEYYPKPPYRMESYSSRDKHSPDRKRMRSEGPSRHEYATGHGGNGRYEASSSSSSAFPPARRSYSGERERHLPTPYTASSSASSRREEFRKPPLPPPVSRPSPRAGRGGGGGGGGGGRISSRGGNRGGILRRERGGGPPRRRLTDRSYAIKKRMVRGEYLRRSNLVRMRSTIGRRIRDIIDRDAESSEEEEVKPKIKIEPVVVKVESLPEKKVEAPAEEAKHIDAEVIKPSKEIKKEKDAEPSSTKKPYVKLVCPHCHLRVPTFLRYESHLQGKTHIIAMKKVAAKQRSILAQMRQAQRNTQNELEKSGEGITEHTVFCPLCKLNYKQERAVHQATSSHKNMKKFLLPTCKICKETYKSPMNYEHHLCSVEHLKRKQKIDNADEEEDLDEFTTIDSIGEVEDNAEAEKEKERKKKRVSVGIEQIKKIDAYYCDLCRMFLPRGTENEYPDILAGHCRKHFHMQRYVRYKETESLKRKAERLQRRETAEKEKKKEDVKEKETKAVVKEDNVLEDSKTAESEETLSKSVDDDKLWDAVDKDLGELLEETDGRDDDEDEERADGERYDRFKSADKDKIDKDEVIVVESDDVVVEEKKDEKE